MEDKSKKNDHDEKIDTADAQKESPGETEVSANKKGEVTTGSDVSPQENRKGSSGPEEKDFTD
jgi:hypothetical protein